MRPLELRLSGFRSYDEETVDLSRLGLVVITGDTGAGKTSLLDAICFALYGCTPEQSGPKELLTLGRTHGEVRLTFAKDGRRHRVTRRYGKDAPEPGHLLETLDEEGAVEARVVGEGAVSAAVRGIVGLTFAAFTSAVLLAQGRFAQFLGSAPRVRDDILRELFDVASLEGARAAAVAAKAGATAEADVLARERGSLPAHPPAARSRAARSARAAAARRALARALVPLARRADAAGAAEIAARATADALAAVLAALPGPERRAELADRVAALEASAAAAGDELERADAALRAAEGTRDAGRARHGGGASDLAALAGAAERLRDLRAAGAGAAERLDREAGELAARRDALAALRAMVEEHRARRETLLARAAAGERRAAAAAEADAAARADAAAARGAEGAQEALKTARAAAEAARGALHEAHRADAAATLRAGLDPGDPCPVCGGEVGHAPAPEAPALAAAADAAGRADAALAAAASEDTRMAAEAGAAAGARAAAERAL
ncbi:MAG: repair protein SbcC/Rad50, partial [Miltoncostaeaceae bacterium]|nr:repair protein SbcC/Rad50 [Miltoncostaeaceae bacterium]